MDQAFWKGKNVLITGHTGFKGSWLSLWLTILGAKVTGFALEPPTNPSLYELANISGCVRDIRGDVRNRLLLQEVVSETRPEVVFHMAAQPIVRESYRNPVETYEVNVMGTVNLLEAVRQTEGVRAVVNITTDKVYENKEWVWGYRENDELGGYDPYSNSKACSELVTSAYRNSFFNVKDYKEHKVAIATVRAGNVIGGGDFGKDRLVPDCIRSILNKETIIIRSPFATRPWQHVLEPLYGYLLLAERLYNDGMKVASAWNFGPKYEEIHTVEEVVSKLCEMWKGNAEYKAEKNEGFHEAGLLTLDYSKAKHALGWEPKWSLDIALEKVIEWVEEYKNSGDVQEVCKKQIDEFMHWGKRTNAK